MKKLIALVILAAAGGAAWWHFKGAAVDAKKPAAKFRTAKIARTDLVKTVEATGTVQPIKKVEVGAQVNGRIVKLFVDYNSLVTNGQVVALIDPLVYDAQYKSALGSLHANEANVKKCEAALALAEKTLTRKTNLSRKDMAPIADYDSALEARDSARAQLEQARAQVEQSVASVSQAKANLDYCTIVSPVNGVVIERSVDEGQTVVSSMNAVPLLTLAESLKVIQVEASVPEADVGSIRIGQKVMFTADAYRQKFTGTVRQIRLAAETVNNVVTYPIIIEAANPDVKLFPGMTANISVETARADGVPAITAAAFRFRPTDADRAAAEARLGEIPRGRKIWIRTAAGELEPKVVEEGVNDDTFIEIRTAGLDGAEVVIGYEQLGPQTKPGAAAGGSTNPFMPKPPQRNKNKGTAPEPKK